MHRSNTKIKNEDSLKKKQTYRLHYPFASADFTSKLNTSRAEAKNHSSHSDIREDNSHSYPIYESATKESNFLGPENHSGPQMPLMNPTENPKINSHAQRALPSFLQPAARNSPVGATKKALTSGNQSVLRSDVDTAELAEALSSLGKESFANEPTARYQQHNYRRPSVTPCHSSASEDEADENKNSDGADGKINHPETRRTVVRKGSISRERNISMALDDELEDSLDIANKNMSPKATGKSTRKPTEEEQATISSLQNGKELVLQSYLKGAQSSGELSPTTFPRYSRQSTLSNNSQGSPKEQTPGSAKRRVSILLQQKDDVNSEYKVVFSGRKEDEKSSSPGRSKIRSPVSNKENASEQKKNSQMSRNPDYSSPKNMLQSTPEYHKQASSRRDLARKNYSFHEVDFGLPWPVLEQEIGSKYKNMTSKIQDVWGSWGVDSNFYKVFKQHSPGDQVRPSTPQIVSSFLPQEVVVTFKDEVDISLMELRTGQALEVSVIPNRTNQEAVRIAVPKSSGQQRIRVNVSDRIQFKRLNVISILFHSSYGDFVTIFQVKLLGAK